MSVNIFKNGILSKIAGAVGDAVPLINNFLTNQAGKGAADANTVYVLNNKIDELNNSLGGLNFGKDGDGNYGYYGADGSLIPFSSFKNLKALTAEKPSSDTYSINGYTVECKATSLYGSSYPARYAFSYGRNSWSSSRGTTNQYATIEFSQEVTVKLARVIDDNESGALSEWKLQYSDDGTTFYDIEENIIFSGINCKIFSCETGAHKYYRFFQSTWGTGHYEIFGDY